MDTSRASEILMRKTINFPNHSENAKSENESVEGEAMAVDIIESTDAMTKEVLVTDS